MKRLRNFFAGLLLLALIGFLGLWMWGKREFQRQTMFNAYIEEAAQRYNMSANIIRSVIWRESDFDPQATGRAEERGLMQVTPTAGEEWANSEKITSFQATDLFDPRTNIMAGTWYLSRAQQRWNTADKPLVFALAEYNAGRTHARRWASGMDKPTAAVFLENVDFPTTKAYVLAILKKLHRYDTEPTPDLWSFVFDKIESKWWQWKTGVKG